MTDAKKVAWLTRDFAWKSMLQSAFRRNLCIYCAKCCDSKCQKVSRRSAGFHKVPIEGKEVVVLGDYRQTGPIFYM